jgi:hypothetical protein
MRIRIACRLDSQSRRGFWKNDRTPVRAVRTIQYSNLLFYLLLQSIIHQTRRRAALCFRHSQTLLSSTPKIAAALWFPFSSVHRITSRLNFAVYDNSLLDFRRPSSVTTVHDKLEQAPPTFQQPRVRTHILQDGAERPAACDLNLWNQVSENTSAAGGDNLTLRAAVCVFVL